MDQAALIASLVSLLTALGGWKFISHILNRNSEKREREIKNNNIEMEALRKQIDWMQKKYEAVSEKLDELYKRFRALEEEKVSLITENSELRIALKMAEYDRCVRPDDDCVRRLPKREKCRLRMLLNGDYEAVEEIDSKAKEGGENGV